MVQLKFDHGLKTVQLKVCLCSTTIFRIRQIQLEDDSEAECLNTTKESDLIPLVQRFVTLRFLNGSKAYLN